MEEMSVLYVELSSLRFTSWPKVQYRSLAALPLKMSARYRENTIVGPEQVGFLQSHFAYISELPKFP
jgi:hypothetical protein